MRWLRQWAPAVAWAAVIALFSTGHFSASTTSRVIVPLLHWLFPQASAGTLETLHFAIRKAAHFTEYFIFSLLLLRGIRGERAGWIVAWGLAAVAIAAGCAALDEAHQAFLPGRTASAWDVLIDSSGAVGAQLLAWLRPVKKKARPEGQGGLNETRP
jgi:VanZ family protein